MAGPELGKVGKKKAKTGNSGDRAGRLGSGIIGDAMEGESDGGDEELEEEESQDPLVVFGSGIMMMIVSKLDARSVALSGLVSLGWKAVASSDKIWAPKENKG